MLCHESPYTRILVLDALLEFSKYAEVQATMADSSFVVPLVGMLRERDINVQCSLFATVAELIKYGFPELPQFRKALLECAAKFFEYEDLKKEMDACKSNPSTFKLAFIEAPSIRAIAYSPSGERIATGSQSGSLAVWDASTCDLMAGQVNGHSAEVNSIAFSPDGRFIATGSGDGTIRVWNAETCEAVSEPFEGHSDKINAIAYSPNGEFIASGSGDRTIWVWNVKTGEAIYEPFRGHTRAVFSVKYSPDGKNIASGSFDKPIRFWNGETGEAVSEPFPRHADEAFPTNYSPDSDNTTFDSIYGYYLAYSPNGQHIASGYGSEIRVCSLHTGKLIVGPMQTTGGVCFVAYSPDGKRIVAGCSDSDSFLHIQVWGADTGETVVGPWKAGCGTWFELAYSPDGLRIASASSNANIRVWNAETGENVFNPI
ncbi:hypothetical protein HWV62_14280 [Athelia sp. TMB]|nr:hypothetical protein HWV62_14280 [Athelia sp. TMB]